MANIFQEATFGCIQQHQNSQPPCNKSNNNKRGQGTEWSLASVPVKETEAKVTSKTMTCQIWRKWHCPLSLAPLLLSNTYNISLLHSVCCPPFQQHLTIFTEVWLLLLRASFRLEIKVNCQLMDKNKGNLGSSAVPCKGPKCAGIQLTFCFYTV